MKLAIIAAGDSSRMKEDGIGIPKPLIKINGIPIIERNLRIAYENGIREVACIINEQSEILYDFLTSKEFGVKIKLKVKNTSSSMHSFLELSEMLDEHFCMITGDSVFSESEFASYYNLISNTKYDAVLGITDFIDDEKPLYVNINDESEIESLDDFAKKPHWITAGIYYFKPQVYGFKEMALNNNISKLRNYLRLLSENQLKIYGYKFSKVIDVDHVTDIKQAEMFLSEDTSA